MIEPVPPIQVDPCCHLEGNALARLESFARARGVSATEALHQLLEAATRHLERENAPPSQRLTKRQEAVLESLKTGLSVKEIAGQLGVSEDTVRTHIYRIRCRLNRSDLLSLRIHRDQHQGTHEPLPETIHRADPPDL